MLFNFFQNNGKLHATYKKYLNAEISAQAFVNKCARQKLYYSTPFGEDKSGTPRLWVLSTHESAVKYMPAFTSGEKCRDMMTKMGRAEFMIIEGNLRSLLQALDAHPLLKEFGMVIDPDSEMPIEIAPNIRVTR